MYGLGYIAVSAEQGQLSWSLKGLQPEPKKRRSSWACVYMVYVCMLSTWWSLVCRAWQHSVDNSSVAEVFVSLSALDHCIARGLTWGTGSRSKKGEPYAFVLSDFYKFLIRPSARFDCPGATSGETSHTENKTSISSEIKR